MFFVDNIVHSVTAMFIILFVCRWLDSSKTLFEQDVKDGDLLYLRFKYYPFMDIDPRVSRTRMGERGKREW